MAAIGFGLAVLIVFFALADGIHEQLIDNATRSSLGHLQVFAAGYRADPVLGKALKDPGAAWCASTTAAWPATARREGAPKRKRPGAARALGSFLRRL